MCSSPKGSTALRRLGKRKEFSRTEYEEYASILRRASVCYELAQQKKLERLRFAASHQPILIHNPDEVVKEDEKQRGILSYLKEFLMQPITLRWI